MTNEALTEDVRQFLRNHIENYEQLETLLLLGRAPDLSWTPEAVAVELHWPQELIARAMEHLFDENLVVATAETPVRAFACRPDAARIIGDLSAAYGRDRVAVIDVMTKNALDRMRTSALRNFAKAFLIRKQ